jgi:ABC-type dipeptide/oligopeptide/nickel transport system permease subunit
VPPPDARSHRPGPRSRDWSVAASGTFLVVLGLLAVVGPIVSRYGYDTQDLDHLFGGSDRSHWLGTDQYGRDLLTRVLDGARVSLTVGLTAVLAESLLGVAWGTIAGFAGGRLDSLLMGAVDVLLAFPALLLAVLITGIFGTTLANIVIALTMTAWPGMARTVRSEILALRGREHVEAARALGAAPRRILVHHLVPNTVHLVTARATLDVSAVILIEATLSFIGIGVQPPRPSWGLMISESFQFLHSHPFLLVVPATVLSLTVIAFNLVGQALTERLDPAFRRAA